MSERTRWTFDNGATVEESGGTQHVRAGPLLPEGPRTEDVIQQIVDAAFPTGGTEGPNAWTDDRIRVRTRFARQLERILTPEREAASPALDVERYREFLRLVARIETRWVRTGDEELHNVVADLHDWYARLTASPALDVERLARAMMRVNGSSKRVEEVAAEYARLTAAVPEEPLDVDERPCQTDCCDAQGRRHIHAAVPEEPSE